MYDYALNILYFRVQRRVGWFKTGLDDLVELRRPAEREKSRSSNSVSDTYRLLAKCLCCAPLKKANLLQCIIKLRHRVQDGTPWILITASVLCTGTPRG